MGLDMYQWGLEYADCIFYRRLSPHDQQMSYPRNDTLSTKW